MIFNRKLIRFSAISVYLGIIIFFFSILLSDVKVSSNAFVSFLDYNNFFDKSNIAPLITVIGTTFTFFAITITSYGDFSRYVKNEDQLKKGNLSLLLNLLCSCPLKLYATNPFPSSISFSPIAPFHAVVLPVKALTKTKVYPLSFGSVNS